MKLVTLATIVFVFGVLVGSLMLRPAHAQGSVSIETPVKEYRERMASEPGRTVMSAYVRGLGEGIDWANSEASKKKPLYCEPTFFLSVETYIDILNRTIKKREELGDQDRMPIGLLLLYGLQETFPCPNGK